MCAYMRLCVFVPLALTQVDELRALLAPRYGTALEIGSVDGFQGREKEAVGAHAVPLRVLCSVVCMLRECPLRVAST